MYQILDRESKILFQKLNTTVAPRIEKTCEITKNLYRKVAIFVYIFCLYLNSTVPNYLGVCFQYVAKCHSDGRHNIMAAEKNI